MGGDMRHATRAQQGVALLVVLWACTLLAIVLGGYAMLARTEGIQARYQVAQTQARYLAEAGVMRALYELPGQRLQHAAAAGGWLADGRPYGFRMDQSEVTVSIVDEDGKVNPNRASADLLRSLFVAAGADDARAQALATAIVAWRAPPAVADPAQASAAASDSHAPRHAPFATLEELQLVPGMTQDLYAKVSPALTLWSYGSQPVALHAPLLVLAALPGMNRDKARQFVQAREAAASTDVSLLPPLPSGVVLGGLRGSAAETIRAEACMPDGARAVLRVTVRADLVQNRRASGELPYTILRWQEGDEE